MQLPSSEPEIDCVCPKECGIRILRLLTTQTPKSQDFQKGSGWCSTIKVRVAHCQTTQFRAYPLLLQPGNGTHHPFYHGNYPCLFAWKKWVSFPLPRRITRVSPWEFGGNDSENQLLDPHQNLHEKIRNSTAKFWSRENSLGKISLGESKVYRKLWWTSERRWKFFFRSQFLGFGHHKVVPPQL